MVRGEFGGKNTEGSQKGREPFRAIAPTRNRRDVWTVTPKPYKGAHFAVYPEDLVEPCIQAGTSARGVCPQCGAPWKRVTERTRKLRTEFEKGDPRYRPNTYDGSYGEINGKGDAGYTDVITLGWVPSCNHGTSEPLPEILEGTEVEVVPLITPFDPIPATVLDIFNGSGTTGAVALRLGRSYIGIELNPKYIVLSQKRLAKVNLPLFPEGREA